MASGLGKSAASSHGGAPPAITYTKTWEVRHTNSDEQSLVGMEMDQFGSKNPKDQSSSTSISSL